MVVHLDRGFIALGNIIYITDIPNAFLSYILTRKYLNPQKKVLKHTQKKLSKQIPAFLFILQQANSVELNGFYLFEWSFPKRKSVADRLKFAKV